MVNPRERSHGHECVLYDADLVPSPEIISFDPRQLAERGALCGQTPGRGVTYFIRLQESDCALRHYRRGGVAARVLQDRYLWTGLERTRAWREWRLLQRLWERGLPVPRPVAARVVRSGPFYRADIITERLAGARSLTTVLSETVLDEGRWRAIGVCIRRFHDAGVRHADLNAHNVLLTPTDGIFLVDFDKGRLGKIGPRSRRRNVARLYRSLCKLRALSDAFRFSDEAWQALLEGYGGDTPGQ